MKFFFVLIRDINKMGLSDEGLILVLVFTWVPLLLFHFYIIRRAKAVADGASTYNKNLVALVAFVMILALYVVVCTTTMYAAMHDRQADRTFITQVAEVVWLFSPVVATISVIRIGGGLYPSAFKVFPSSRPEILLCLKRAFAFGIPLCFVFAAGDQVLRKLVALAVTKSLDSPVPMNSAFIASIGNSFGIENAGTTLSLIIGYISNFTIGPIVDLFAPSSDSVFDYGNNANTGVGLYLLYAIPEEIGWTGALYPMLMTHFAPSVRDQLGSPFWPVAKAIFLTGFVWALWHSPFIILKWNPTIDSLLGFFYQVLFLLSCLASRVVLIALSWPVYSGTSNLLETSGSVKNPSLFPAIFAHAAMNVWWNFFNCLYDWSSAPAWSITTGSEFSVLAVAWQFAIAFGMLQFTLKRKSSPRRDSASPH